jgi:hypothetical protein
MIPRYLMQPGGVRLLSSRNNHTGVLTVYPKHKDIGWRVKSVCLFALAVAGAWIWCLS